jgi:hypothetical protein
MPPSRSQPTIAQQILQSAPYHPAAKHGRRELEDARDKVQQQAILRISTKSSSIVDGWMKDMLKHGKEESHEAELALSEQPRQLRWET